MPGIPFRHAAGRQRDLHIFDPAGCIVGTYAGYPHPGQQLQFRRGLVGAGTGLSIVPYSALQSANCENVRILPLDESWARRSLRVCVRNDGEARLPYVAKLIEHLRKQGDRPSAA